MTIKSLPLNLTKKYCYTPKCKAACCLSAPIPINIYNKLKSSAVRKTIFPFPAPPNNRYCKDAIVTITTCKALKFAGKSSMGNNMWSVNLFTDGNYCAFLRSKGYKCNIYKHRPPICRNFGTIKDIPCRYQINLVQLIAYKTINHAKKILSRAASLF